MKNNKKPIKEFFQRLIITFNLFDKNKLFGHAASTAFNFLLSIIPILFMIIVVLVRFLNASPETIKAIYDYFPGLERYFSTDDIISNILKINKIGFFEIILGFSIIWAARKLFFSVQADLSIIYLKKSTRTLLKENLITFAVEVVVVVVIAAVLIAYTAFKEFLKLDLAQNILSPILIQGLSLVTKMLPASFLFFLCAYFYHNTPGEKPSFKIVFFSAFLCTLTFFIVQTFFTYFINMTRYNIMYGILSNLIIIMLSVYVFFMFFLFFAQFTYVCQYFDTQLLTRIYLLQKEPQKGFLYEVNKYFFMEPYSLYRQYAKHLSPGDIIYNQNDKTTSVFYTFWGVVEEFYGEDDTKNHLYIKGEVFGEIDCILHQKRHCSARAISESVILEIPSKIFESIIHENHEASEKIIKELSEFIINR